MAESTASSGLPPPRIGPSSSSASSSSSSTSVVSNNNSVNNNSSAPGGKFLVPQWAQMGSNSGAPAKSQAPLPPPPPTTTTSTTSATTTTTAAITNSSSTYVNPLSTTSGGYAAAATYRSSTNNTVPNSLAAVTTSSGANVPIANKSSDNNRFRNDGGSTRYGTNSQGRFISPAHDPDRASRFDRADRDRESNFRGVSSSSSAAAAPGSINHSNPNFNRQLGTSSGTGYSRAAALAPAGGNNYPPSDSRFSNATTATTTTSSNMNNNSTSQNHKTVIRYTREELLALNKPSSGLPKSIPNDISEGLISDVSLPSALGEVLDTDALHLEWKEALGRERRSTQDRHDRRMERRGLDQHSENVAGSPDNSHLLPSSRNVLPSWRQSGFRGDDVSGRSPPGDGSLAENGRWETGRSPPDSSRPWDRGGRETSSLNNTGAKSLLPPTGGMGLDIMANAAARFEAEMRAAREKKTFDGLGSSSSSSSSSSTLGPNGGGEIPGELKGFFAQTGIPVLDSPLEEGLDMPPEEQLIPEEERIHYDPVLGESESLPTTTKTTKTPGLPPLVSSSMPSGGLPNPNYRAPINTIPATLPNSINTAQPIVAVATTNAIPINAPIMPGWGSTSAPSVLLNKPQPSMINNPANTTTSGYMLPGAPLHQQLPLSTTATPSSSVSSGLTMNSIQWLYQDPSGSIQGPFSPQEMREWFDAGFFKPHLPICVAGGRSNVFLPLSSFYPDLSMAFKTFPLHLHQHHQQQQQQQQNFEFGQMQQVLKQERQLELERLAAEQERKAELERLEHQKRLYEQHQRQLAIEHQQQLDRDAAIALAEARRARQQQEMMLLQQKQQQEAEQQQQQQQQQQQARIASEESSKQHVEPPAKVWGNTPTPVTPVNLAAIQAEEARKAESASTPSSTAHKSGPESSSKKRGQQVPIQFDMTASEAAEASARPAWGKNTPTQPVARLSLKEIQEQEERQRAHQGPRPTSMAEKIAASVGVPTKRFADSLQSSQQDLQQQSSSSGGWASKAVAAPTVVIAKPPAPVVVSTSTNPIASSSKSTQATATAVVATTTTAPVTDTVALPKLQSVPLPQVSKSIPSSTTSTVETETSSNVMSSELRQWCIAQVRDLKKDMAIADFNVLIDLCYTIHDGSEIRDYIRGYLGETPAVDRFAMEFIRQKETEADFQKVRSGDKKGGKKRR